MRILPTAGLAFLCLAHALARADSAPADTCDIQLDMRLSVYMVTVQGVPYRNKRYLTFSEAATLRDVLQRDGECEELAPPRACELRLLAAGEYAVMRDGVNFDPYARLRTLNQAKRHVRSLEKLKLCTLSR